MPQSIPLADLFASPAPRPSPRPSPSVIPLASLFGPSPAPAPTANPLDNLFAPPSPSPLAPPVGPDVVDVPGEEEGILARVTRALRSLPPGYLPSAFDSTPAPTVAPLQGTEALGAAYRGIQGAISLPAQAVDAASQRVTGRPAGDVLGEAMGRAAGMPPERLQEGVRATERVAAAHPSVPGLGIAARAAGVGAAMTDEATKVAGKLGADPAMYLLPASKALQAFFVPGMVESAGEEFAQARALYEAAGNKVTPEVGRAVVRAVASTAFAAGGALHMARESAGGPVTADRVSAAAERLRAPAAPVEARVPTPERPIAERVAAALEEKPKEPPAGAPGGPALDVEGKPVTPPPTTPTTTTTAPTKAVHPDLDLLTSAADALAKPSGRTSSLIRDGLGNVIGRTGNTAHPAKVEYGLTGFTEGPARLAAALRRIAAGKPSDLGERVLAQMKAYGEEARLAQEAKRVAANTEAGRASFDPDALELPPIEGASHGEGTDYRDVVLSAANTHLGPVEGRGVVSGNAPTGQRWYGFKGEDGAVSAALGIREDGLVTDWAGTGPGTGLVVRRAAKENPDLRIDFDSISDESAPLLNRVMNSGGKWGEAVRVQYEAHLRERGLHPDQAEGGTVPPEGPNGPRSAGGPDSGGGRGGGSGGKPPETVVEPFGEGTPREGQGGGGSGAPPNGPPATGGVGPGEPGAPGESPAPARQIAQASRLGRGYSAVRNAIRDYSTGLRTSLDVVGDIKGSDGTAGPKIKAMAEGYLRDWEVPASRDRGDFEGAIRNLTKAEQQDVIRVLDEGAAPSSPRVASAAKQTRAILDRVAGDARAADVFVGYHENYFPHRWAGEGFDFDVIARKLADEKFGGDITRATAELNRMVQFGERRNPNLERERSGSAPDYERSFDVIRDYIVEARERIALAKHFGPKMEKVQAVIDTIPPSRVGTMFPRSYAQTFVRRLTGREPVSFGADIGTKIRTAQAVTKLGLASITQLNQIAPLVAREGLVAPIRGLARAITDFEGTKTEATSSGSLWPNILGETSKTVGGDRGGFNWGVGKSDKFMRVLADASSRVYFDNLVKRGRWAELESLGVTRELVESNRAEAQMRVAKALTDVTQTRTGVEHLPLWATSPAGRVVMQFRNFGYGFTTQFLLPTMARAAKGDPQAMRTLMVLVIAGAGVGKATSEAKRKIREEFTRAMGGTPRERSQRSELLMDRYGDLAASGAVGLIDLIVQAARSKNAAAALGGPTVGEVDAFNRRVWPSIAAGDYEKAGRSGAKLGLEQHFPIFGRQLGDYFFPREER